LSTVERNEADVPANRSRPVMSRASDTRPESEETLTKHTVVIGRSTRSPVRHRRNGKDGVVRASGLDVKGERRTVSMTGMLSGDTGEKPYGRGEPGHWHCPSRMPTVASSRPR